VKLLHLVGFILNKFVTMHGHMNAKRNTVGDVAPSNFVNWYHRFGGTWQSPSIAGKGEPREQNFMSSQNQSHITILLRLNVSLRLGAGPLWNPWPDISLVVRDIALAFWRTRSDARINSAHLHFYLYTLYLKTVEQ
jgi:hypothetical protein